MEDARTRRGAEIASNHHIVVANLNLKLKKNWKTGQTALQRFNTAFLRDTDKLNEFKIAHSKRFQALQVLFTGAQNCSNQIFSINDDDDSFSSYGEIGHRENNPDRLLNKGNLTTFILRIKDIGLTKSSTNMNGISSAFASSSSTSILSLSSFGSVLSNNNDLILATGSACPSNSGIACSHDYLSVDARISTVYDGAISNIPIIRFCSINNSTLNTIATKRKTKLPEVEMINSSSSSLSSSSSISFGSFSLNSIDYNKLYPPDESYLFGQICGLISLSCVAINTSSDNGVVDYQFRVNQQTSHTFAYAEVFCPSYRWLEPMNLDLDEINPSQSCSPISSRDNRSSLNHNNIRNPW
ncbi:unnamed protein product [Schistosoma margrebowiei]|uniref:Uncharacterized protein n=1 Tax=Schistosoma margrebowiei TaxID=48269 RepID=A0A183MVG8_9TREM|nr:unnamed protein product [Schistosoma margrebowiei]